MHFYSHPDSPLNPIKRLEAGPDAAMQQTSSSEQEREWPLLRQPAERHCSENLAGRGFGQQLLGAQCAAQAVIWILKGSQGRVLQVAGMTRFSRLWARRDDVGRAASSSHPGSVLHHRCACSSCWEPTQPKILSRRWNQGLAVRDLVCAASPEDTFCLSSTQQPSRRAQEDLLRSRCPTRRSTFLSPIPSPDIAALSNPCSLITSLRPLPTSSSSLLHVSIRFNGYFPLTHSPGPLIGSNIDF